MRVTTCVYKILSPQELKQRKSIIKVFHIGGGHLFGLNVLEPDCLLPERQNPGSSKDW